MWSIKPGVRRWPNAAISFATALAILSPSRGRANLDTRYRTRPVALTISGGVSLGSYEAGVNWALVRVLRESEADLVAVTGASAGNINTLLTAYSWCGIDPLVQKPEESLFWKAWIPVDINGLVPREFETGYTRDEGLFTRAAFVDAIKRLETLSTAQATSDCELRLGITLSKREPGVVKIPAGTKQLEVPAMRYVVPFKAAASKGQQLKFSSPTSTEIHTWNIEELGLHLLPGAPGVEIPLKQQLLDYVFAASAFPYAFGSMRLTYWEPVADNYTSKPGIFLDGGVFDNVPVGLSLRLLTAGSAPPPVPTGANSRFVFYIDPDQRRNARPPADSPAQVPLAGFNSVFTFLDGAVNSARKHELQTVARYDLRTMPAELRLTARTTNVFGEYYAAFGAFADQRFREMDFYLGLFDGLMSAAEWDCENQPAPLERCVVDKVFEMKRSLALASSSPLASYVVDRLLVSNFPAEASRSAISPQLPDAGRTGGIKPMEVKVMLDVLTAKEHDSFPALLVALSTAGSENHLEWDSFVINDPSGFAAEYANRLLLRALTIERWNGRHGSIRPLAVASLVTRSIIPQRSFEWDPSTIPDSKEKYAAAGAQIGHFVPYYLGFEFMPTGEFGFRAQWRPTQPLGSRLRLIIPAEAGWLGRSQGVRLGVGLGAKFIAVPSIGLSLDAVAGTGVWGRDLSASLRPNPQELKVDTSIQAGLAIFESLRVGYTYYPGPKLHSISLGLIDFNGITYWLGRTATGI